MPTYDYKCVDCEIVVTEYKNYEDRDVPSICSFCGGSKKRLFKTAPGQMNTALPDGTPRKGFADLKEAAKLEAEAFDSKPAERKRIEKEVAKLRETKK